MAVQPELLAPAGDWDALRAAVANGADAVYFGLGNFNARQRATNFTREELGRVMEFLHAHNVRGYLAFNTLIFAEELAEAEAWIKQIATAGGVGVDAVIVQDLGLARLSSKAAPGLEVHASTQMTLTEAEGIEFVRSLGIKRVIVARELSVADIARLHAMTDVPLEVFVHGALCVAYSGQCLTSESLGGRSANRGQCAQACRLPYELIVDGAVRPLADQAYLLSPQDLAAHGLVKDLLAAGVTGFKIEGRLKSAHYVAATTQIYRAALDAAVRGQGFAIDPVRKLDLEQSFSRGFTTGFLRGVDHQALVSGRFPKARGTRIGQVAAKTPRSIVVRLDAPARGSPPLKPGDGVVFDEGHPEQDEQGGRIFAVRPAGADRLEIELGHGDVNLAAVADGAIVWKTDDPAIRRRLEHSFSRDVVVRRVPVHVTVHAQVGRPLGIEMRDDDGHVASVVADGVLEPARKFAATPDAIRRQLSRMGDTIFDLASVQLVPDPTAASAGPGPMVPHSVLNDLRRRACRELMLLRRRPRVEVVDGALPALRCAPPPGPTPSPPPPAAGALRLHVLVRTLEQLEAVLGGPPIEGVCGGAIYCDFEDVRRCKLAVERCRQAGRPVGLATVRIVKPGEEGLLQAVADCRPDLILARNLAAVSYCRRRGLAMVADYSLNIANDLTAGILHEAGGCGWCPVTT